MGLGGDLYFLYVEQLHWGSRGEVQVVFFAHKSMIIAQHKRKENIAEYLLYMWQVEDLIRAAGCDSERVEQLILARYNSPEVEIEPIRQWYAELMDMMRTEGKQERGHLDVNRIVLMQLEDLHRRLLQNPNDYIYQGLHYQILPAVIQLRTKGQMQDLSDLETCFNAVYGYLTLKLKGETISEETEKSVRQISTFLAMLAHKYKLEQEGEAQGVLD